METITKCGNCGSELKRVTVSGGKWRWIPFLFFLLLISKPMWQNTFFKKDFSKDLVISEVETRKTDHTVEILGLLTNQGKTTWRSIKVEAEFYDAKGNFIDEGDDHIWSDVKGQAKERFKIQIRSNSPYLRGEDIKTVVKVSSARAPFY